MIIDFRIPHGEKSTSVLLSSFFFILVQQLLKSFEGLRELAKQCFGWLFQSFLWMNFKSSQPLTSTWTSLLKVACLIFDLSSSEPLPNLNEAYSYIPYISARWMLADHPKGPFTPRTITIMTTILALTNGHQWILFCLSNKHMPRLCRLPL